MIQLNLPGLLHPAGRHDPPDQGIAHAALTRLLLRRKLCFPVAMEYGISMDTAVRTNARSIMLATLQEHAGRMIVAFILIALAAGTLFHVALLNYFDQSLFVYWKSSDLLAAPLHWPAAFLLSLCVVGIGTQMVCLRAQSQAGLRIPSRAFSLGDSRVTAVAALLLAMVAFVLLIYALAYRQASMVWNQPHNDIRIELAGNAGHINGKEIAVLNGFRFLLADETGFSNRGTKRFIAVPAEQVLAITRCAQAGGNTDGCSQADLFTRPVRNNTAASSTESAAPEIAAPVQEQPPEPYQRNRLIKEPDF